MWLENVSDDAATLTFRPRPEMRTAWNTLHGGVLSGLVEFLSFVALLTTITADELPVTNDIFLQHVRALPGDTDYRLAGRLINRGRTMAWTEVSVFADDRLVSMARITKTLVPMPGSRQWRASQRSSFRS